MIMSTDGYVYIAFPVLGNRSVQYGGVDSAGAGYRYLRINN
jgi:hypothetical protein